MQRTTQIAPFEYALAGTRAHVFADAELLAAISHDHSLDQLANVTALPGIVGDVYGMPDMHEGYGFPVGGVAATAAPDGAISPGGIGFDINCGVRLLASELTRAELEPQRARIVHDISRTIPSGYGRGGRLVLQRGALDAILARGCRELIETHGAGEPDDLDLIESGGCLPGADPSAVSDRARTRGSDQLGTLGGGNHFVEVEVVEQVFDPCLGLHAGQIVVLIHTGSRGLGHQVCTDFVRLLDAVQARYGISLPDRQLACAPLSSPEGQRYLAAMRAAANFAFANRQLIAHRIRGVFGRELGARGHLRMIYDVGHNTAKLERHGGRELCVHRKGATRAFGPSNPELPARYRGVGQPVFIPGSMGTASYVLLGTDEAEARSLASVCHGAGRVLSRGAAKRQVAGNELRRALQARGIAVECPSNSELAEEAPDAYKDVDRVVDVVIGAGLARKVARLVPLGVVKG
jgi:tRNA-splicing ligase RtcB (3'-phosphate/5'-hydroxy nucleic acid ligase)